MINLFIYHLRSKLNGIDGHFYTITFDILRSSFTDAISQDNSQYINITRSKMIRIVNLLEKVLLLHIIFAALDLFWTSETSQTCMV